MLIPIVLIAVVVNGAIDHRDAIAHEHIVEHRRELAVAITDQESELAGALAEIHEEVTGLLGSPCLGGVRRDARDVYAAALDLHHEEHVQALEER